MAAAGAYNVLKNPKTAGLNFGNNPNNPPFISKGVRDYFDSSFGPPATIPDNSFQGNPALAAPADRFKSGFDGSFKGASDNTSRLVASAAIGSITPSAGFTDPANANRYASSFPQAPDKTVVSVEPHGWLSSMIRNGEVERIIKPNGAAPPSAGGSPDSSASFDDRFGTWPSSLTGGAGNPLSPFPRGLRKRSAAPDDTAWASAQGATSATPAYQQDAMYSPDGYFFGNFPRASAVAAAPSPLAFDDSGSGTRTAGDFDATAPGLSRLMSGVGQFLLNSLITPPEAAPLSAPPPPSLPAPDWPGEEAQGAPSNASERRLSRRILNSSAGIPGNTRSPPTQEPQESEGPLTLNEAYLLYLARLNARRAQASMSDPAEPIAPFDAPDRNPPGFSAADWIASLAGVDRQNPTQPASSGVPASPIDSSDNANYSGGLPGRYLALTGLDPENPNQPAPTDDEQEQANLQALEDKLSSTGDIRDAVALYKARKAIRARGAINQA